MSGQTIPIIIINWRGLEDTLECMTSALQLEGVSFHIHLIDNGSGDDSARVLQDTYGNDSRVTLHLFEDNTGFTGGNNRVMAWLLEQYDSNEMPWIALLNNDTAIEPNWLQALFDCGEQTGAGMVTSKMIIYDDRTLMDNAGHYMLNTGEILPLGHRQPVGRFESRIENMGACAGAVLYSSAMLRDIGLFDDHFSTGYEDAELGLRAVVCGYSCWYEPRAVVYHKGGQSLNKVRNLRYLVSIQSHILYSYYKLMPGMFLWLNMPLMVLRYIMIFGFDLLFLRRNYLIMHTTAWWEQIIVHGSERTKKRRSLFLNRSIRSGREMFSRIEWFWHTDWRRLKEYIGGKGG